MLFSVFVGSTKGFWEISLTPQLRNQFTTRHNFCGPPGYISCVKIHSMLSLPYPCFNTRSWSNRPGLVSSWSIWERHLQKKVLVQYGPHDVFCSTRTSFKNGLKSLHDKIFARTCVLQATEGFKYQSVHDHSILHRRAMPNIGGLQRRNPANKVF